MSTPIFIVLTSGITAEQRKEIHELLKGKSAGWWHHLPDVWLVRGNSTTFWRDLVLETVRREEGAAVLVFRLDNTSIPPAWSGEGKNEMYDWIKTYYRKE